MRSSSRVCDLFRAWDEDSSGTVDKTEFHRAVRALGFDVEKADTDAVFESISGLTTTGASYTFGRREEAATCFPRDKSAAPASPIGYSFDRCATRETRACTHNHKH